MGVIWLALLAALESTDVLTTAIDRARGSIESMPFSNAVLNVGGMGLFAVLKLGLVGGAAIALFMAVGWLRRQHTHGKAVYVYVLSAIRIVSVVLAITCLNNALLLSSLD